VPNDQDVQRTEQYAYDRLSRLTGVNHGDGEVQSYTFDPMGNRLSRTVNGIQEGYTYNNANMLLTRGAASYTNDANGNTLTDGASNRSMTWDSQNRMASCTYAGQTSTFTYGADGLRRRMVTGANTTDYLLDGQSVVREIKNGVVDATYLNGPRGPEYKRDQNGAVSWYLYDGLGSVVGLVDQSGNVTNTRKYDVYGAPRNAQTGTAHCFVGSLGHTSDAETGLIYMRARYYDPAAGRFVSEDRVKDGPNWFIYCDNDPVNKVDATGNSADGIVDGLIAGLILEACKLIWGERGTLIAARILAETSRKMTGEYLEILGRALQGKGKQDTSDGAKDMATGGAIYEGGSHWLGSMMQAEGGAQVRRGIATRALGWVIERTGKTLEWL
jgi:RHS repeat-associated protein